MDAYWAHVLWQRHGLRIEDYEKMTEAQKAFYIASERYEDEHPCRKDGYMFRTAVKGGVNDGRVIRKIHCFRCNKC